MKKHTCKHCNRIFEYCRGCLLSPIPHKDAGFCSKDCYEASKKVVEPVVELEPIVEEIATVKEVEEEINPSTEDVQLVEEVSVETPIIEAVTPIIKQETYNAYKHKHKKHR